MKFSWLLIWLNYICNIVSKVKSVYFHKKLFAICLLLVFSIGVTPRKYLHTFFSNHTDFCSFIH